MFQIGDKVTVDFPHKPRKVAVIVDIVPAGESRALKTLQRYYGEKEGARVHKLGALRRDRIVYQCGNTFGVIPDVPQNRGILTKG